MAAGSTILRLGPADHGRVVSSEEFAEADFEEPWAYEREEGRLVVLPPDGFGHQSEPGVEPIPDLIFEIVGPRKDDRDRDYVTKRAAHESLGVREYVLVDRFDRLVTVLSPGESGHVERILRDVDLYTSPLLPGFLVRIADVF